MPNAMSRQLLEVNSMLPLDAVAALPHERALCLLQEATSEDGSDIEAPTTPRATSMGRTFSAPDAL